METLACAAPAQSIRPARTTGKERILPLASRPWLQHSRHRPPVSICPRSGFCSSRLLGIVKAQAGANKAETGHKAACRAILRERRRVIPPRIHLMSAFQPIAGPEDPPHRDHADGHEHQRDTDTDADADIGDFVEAPAKAA